MIKSGKFLWHDDDVAVGDWEVVLYADLKPKIPVIAIWKGVGSATAENVDF